MAGIATCWSCQWGLLYLQIQTVRISLHQLPHRLNAAARTDVSITFACKLSKPFLCVCVCQNLHWKACHGSACVFSLWVSDIADHRLLITLLGLPTSGRDMSQKLWVYGLIQLRRSHNPSWMGIIYFKVITVAFCKMQTSLPWLHLPAVIKPLLLQVGYTPCRSG